MNEVRVQAKVLRDAYCRSTGLGGLLDILGHKLFGIASWWHGQTRLKS